MIHIRCGDDILDRLRSLDIGPAIKWCDPLCQGPTPAGLSAAGWQDMRARFIASRYGVSLHGARQALRREDAALRAALAHDEIVLWFEADLFDQVILVRLLAWFANHRQRNGQLSLICLGDHPDIDRFVGLGQLSAVKLAALLPRRATVTKEQFNLARRSWDAWCAPERAALDALLAGDTAPLPFLGDAISRHLAELPDPRTGLALTERMALDGVSRGADTAAALFRHIHDAEDRPWLGDLMFWHILDRLAQSVDSPIRIDGPPGWTRTPGGAKATRIAMTGHGRDVLAGRARYASPPRWVGGIRVCR